MKLPIKVNLKTEIIPILIIIGAIVVSILSYSHLPARVVSHWNFAGEPDGYSSKNFQVIFFPALLLIMYLLFYFLPLIDPKKENYAKFTNVYHLFKSLIIAVLFIVYLASTLANLGYTVNIGRVVSLTIGAMMIIIGVLLKNIKNNWFIGIRTPWTMSSETVWKKTHKLSSWLMMLFGAIIIIAPYLPPTWGGWIFLLGAALAIIGPITFSYLAYRQEQKKQIANKP